jgi:hypothetical protein
MPIVPPAPPAVPTNAEPLPRLLAYAQSLGLERHLARPKRGLSTLALAMVWLVLAWRDSGRPHHLDRFDEPPLAALLGRGRLPSPRTLYRSLGRYSARGVRAAVEAAYLAELPHRTGRVWAALDAHQIPYWGRNKLGRFQQGWSGSHSRRRRGYRLSLAVDTDTGQVITFLLARGRMRDHRLTAVLARRVRRLLGRRLAAVVADCGFTSKASVAALLDSRVPFILGFARSAPVRARLAARSGQQRRQLREGGAIRLGACPWDARLCLLTLAARAPSDKRGPWVYATSLRAASPRRLAATYRQRWRVEQAIEELLNGHDLDHLVADRLHPNQVAVGFRLLARNLAIGHQIHAAQARPLVIREPRAFRANHVAGLGTFAIAGPTILLAERLPLAEPPQPCALPWTQCTVHYTQLPNLR